MSAYVCLCKLVVRMVCINKCVRIFVISIERVCVACMRVRETARDSAHVRVKQKFLANLCLCTCAAVCCSARAHKHTHTQTHIHVGVCTCVTNKKCVCVRVAVFVPTIYYNRMYSYIETCVYAYLYKKMKGNNI